MTTVNSVKLGMKRWLQKETGLTVIFAEQAAPRPEKQPYATIRVDSLTPLGGMDESFPVNASGVIPMKGTRQITVTCEIIGNGATNLMERAQASLSKASWVEWFHGDYEISIVDAGAVNNLTGLLETEWEERAQMDVLVYYPYEQEDDVGLIETVEINGEYYDISTP
jgi:hypothetical protein